MSDPAPAPVVDPATLVCAPPPPDPPPDADPHDDWVHQVCGVHPAAYVDPAQPVAEVAPPPAGGTADGAGGAPAAPPGTRPYGPDAGAEGAPDQSTPPAGEPASTHQILDMAGYLPIVGPVANLANAGLYAAEGDGKEAATNLGAAAVSMVPLGKWGAKIAGKLGKTLLADELESAAKALAEKAAANEASAIAAALAKRVAAEAPVLGRLYTEIPRVTQVAAAQSEIYKAAMKVVVALEADVVSGMKLTTQAEANTARASLENLARSKLGADAAQVAADAEQALTRLKALRGELEAELINLSADAAIDADRAAVVRHIDYLAGQEKALEDAMHTAASMSRDAEAMVQRLYVACSTLGIPL